MEKSLFIVLAVCLMMSEAYGQSMSMSCSTVNGKTICNEERNQGNTAMASSSSSSGPQGESMNTYAGAGNPMGDWQSSGQRYSNGNGGGYAGGGFVPGDGYGGGGFAPGGGYAGGGFVPGGFAPGGFAPGGFARPGAGAFAGNFPPGGFDPFRFVFGRR